METGGSSILRVHEGGAYLVVCDKGVKGQVGVVKGLVMGDFGQHAHSGSKGWGVVVDGFVSLL